MDISKVRAVYFSATGTTEKVAQWIAKAAAEQLGADYEANDFTLPENRESPLVFKADELVIFGVPVYAGRVPNVLLKYLDTMEGNNAAAVPVVLYGNRNYDDALIELRDILEKHSLHTLAAAAFIGEHSFSYILAEGRPDDADMSFGKEFASELVEKVRRVTDPADTEPITVKGIPEPYRGYYQPRDRQGKPVDIRKVKPVTKENCNHCLICAHVCPMGSISHDDVSEFTGICIKCGACVKKCPVHAKYYEDEAFLYHQHELEEGLTRRAEPEMFL